MRVVLGLISIINHGHMLETDELPQDSPEKLAFQSCLFFAQVGIGHVCSV